MRNLLKAFWNPFITVTRRLKLTKQRINKDLMLGFLQMKKKNNVSLYTAKITFLDTPFLKFLTC